MKRAFVLFVVAMLYCNFTLAQEPEPDPNLIWKSDSSYNSFVIHPNGNIIASKGLAVAELNGHTGEIIREFPFFFEFYALSKDGKYLAGGIDGLVLIDNETGEIVKTLDVEGSSRVVFMPDNERLLIRTSYEESEKQFCLYNYITDEKSFFEVGSNIGIWSFTISPDGRFLAIGGFIFNPGGENQTILLLYDAVTWKPIKNLATFDEDNEVRTIKFSPDSRLVGFGVYLDDLYIYKTDDYNLYKHYGGHNTEYGIGGFCFIDENLIGHKYGPLTYILNLHNGSVVFKTGVHGGTAQSIIEKNHVNNSLITGSGQLIAWDLNKILTSSVEPNIPNPFSVEYSNNALSIRNYRFGVNSINCTITDINGRIIQNVNFNTSSNDIRIPIKLLNGAYFLHIKDGDKEYVSKFLVVE